MSQTKRDRKHQQEKQQRKNEIRRKANIERNVPADRYRLDVEVDGKWTLGVKFWRDRKSAELHKTNTDEARATGVGILHGRVVDMIRGKIIMDIPDSKAKGAAPDKIEDGSKVEVPACAESKD